jgi:tetratricopeptide (TPR) repeat protein
LNYQKAVSANDTNAVAKYNLACSMMQDLIADKSNDNQKQQVDSTVQAFRQAADLQQNPIRKAQAYRNIGWIYQACEQYAPAIDAYKESLRNNPDDDEVRYNLALCQKLLKEQQQKKQDQNNQDQKDQNQQNQDQQNQNQQNQDKQNQDQDKQDQDQKDQKQQDQQQKQQQDQQQNQQQQEDQNKNQQQQNPAQNAQPNEGQMSKANAQPLLNASEQAEKNSQQILQKGARMPGKRLQKNW